MPFFQLDNPIPYEVRDSSDVYKWIKEHKFIPYYGGAQYSSHRFLYLLRDLCELSPTHTATMQARQAYTFGLNLDVVGRSFPGLAADVAEIGIAEKIQYGEYLRGIGLPLTEINALCREIDEHLTESGNAYLKMQRARVGGAVSYDFEVLDYLHTGFIHSDDPLEQFVLSTPFLLDQAKLDKFPPKVYRVTPRGKALRWMQDQDGTESTVVHLKTKAKAGGGKIYGRPKMLGFLPWYYVDFQDGNHTSKLAAAEVVAKKLLAMEGEDPNALNDSLNDKGEVVDTFAENARVIKEVTTSLSTKGNQLGPKKGQASVALIEYPFGGKPPVDIDLEINRDVEYLKHQGDRASDRVAACLGWDTTLTSFRETSASLGGNLLYDTFTLKDTETVQPLQRYFENVFNDIIGQIMVDEQAPEALRSLGVRFPSVIANVLESINPTAPSGSIPTPDSITNENAQENE